MNHIKIQKVKTPYGYEEDYWSIDGRILTDYLDEKIVNSEDTCLKCIESLNGCYVSLQK